MDLEKSNQNKIETEANRVINLLKAFEKQRVMFMSIKKQNQPMYMREVFACCKMAVSCSLMRDENVPYNKDVSQRILLEISKKSNNSLNSSFLKDTLNQAINGEFQRLGIDSRVGKYKGGFPIQKLSLRVINMGIPVNVHGNDCYPVQIIGKNKIDKAYIAVTAENINELDMNLFKKPGIEIIITGYLKFSLTDRVSGKEVSKENEFFYLTKSPKQAKRKKLSDADIENRQMKM